MAKCEDCGFLAVRNRQTRALSETEASMREKGEPARIPKVELPFYERNPICFLQMNDLTAEMEKLDDKTSFKNVIKKERECKPCTKWIQGFTPREHKEMIDAEKQQTWQRQVEKENKDFAEKIRQEQEQTAYRRFWLNFLFLGIIVPVSLFFCRWLEPKSSVLAPTPADSRQATPAEPAK